MGPIQWELSVTAYRMYQLLAKLIPSDLLDGQVTAGWSAFIVENVVWVVHPKMLSR